MTTPTSNAVPSTSPFDLLFNAEKIDEAVNSPLLEYVDRLGVSRMTLAGAMARISNVNPRGAWTTATLYQPRDIVSNGGTWYIALDLHTSGATFAGDQSAHWRVHQGLLASDLADTASGTKGAGLVGIGMALSYAAGTLGFIAQRMVFAEAFAQGGDSSNVQAFQRAIDHCAALGGGVVMTRMTAISFDAACVLKSNVIVQGLGRGKSVITKTAHTFHGFTDNNTLADGAEVHGFTIRCSTAPTTGQTDRGVFIDANSTTARYRFTDLLCENIFRGVNVHQAGTVEYDNVDGLALLDSTVYIGEVAANRTGAVKMGRSFSSASFTDSPAGGGGVIVLAYVDDVTPGYSKFVNCGPSSGAVNLYHGLYLRTCGSCDAGYIKATGQKRGAPLHVFADNAAGEPNCGDTVATVISEGAVNYVGVRVDRCDKFILRAGSKISASALQAGYFTNSGPITLEAGVRALNNNGDAVTSAVGSAAWRISACADFTAQGVVMIDDTSTAGQYGQGTGFAFEGACPRYTVDSCQMVFPAAATGYFFISHESGSTVTYPQITHNYTSGPQSFLNEGGTVVPAGQGVMRGNTRDSATNSPLLNVEQLHRWRVADNWNQGARFNYESDGKNVTAWLTNFPSTDTWVRDDIVKRIDATAGATPGWRCTTGGTSGTWKAEASLAA